MMTPTITLMQKSRVSVLVKRLRYSLCRERGWLSLGGWQRDPSTEMSPQTPVWGTHGVSSITLHTQAMVLRQSVVSSIGRVLF